jgi:hypothetical protein
VAYHTERDDAADLVRRLTARWWTRGSCILEASARPEGRLAAPRHATAIHVVALTYDLFGSIFRLPLIIALASRTTAFALIASVNPVRMAGCRYADVRPGADARPIANGDGCALHVMWCSAPAYSAASDSERSGFVSCWAEAVRAAVCGEFESAAAAPAVARTVSDRFRGCHRIRSGSTHRPVPLARRRAW